MAELPIYKYKVGVTNEDAISLNTIVRDPRVYKPQDLLSACHNTEIAGPPGPPSPYVEVLVQYLLNEFFVLAHRTGLYNRQRALWESLSRVVAVNVFQRTTGLIRKKCLPLFDLDFLDYRGRPLVYAHLVEPGFELADKQALKLLKSTINRAQRLSGLVGVLLCCPAPFPDAVKSKVAGIIQADDPVARYESLLPIPGKTAIDLLEMHLSAPSDGEPQKQDPWIHLVHPDLTVQRRNRSNVADV